MFRKGKALCVEVIIHEAEGTRGEEIGGCIDVAGVFGA